MLDKTEAIVSVDFSAEEKEILSRARRAGRCLQRMPFEYWTTIGAAVAIAKKHGDAVGGRNQTRGAKFRAILTEEGLGWLNHNTCIRLLQIMRELPAVLAWRETLSDYARAHWSSPQTIVAKSPVFVNSRAKPPSIQAKPLSVSALLRMPGAQAAQLLVDRNPSKAWSLRRALDELLDEGTAPRPRSGWATGRERGHAASAAA
jgi:hypothetical protein